MKITVTELTEGVETHKMIVGTAEAAGEYIQKRVHELDLVLDICLYLTPEGKQVKFPLTLELIDNQKEVAALLKSCPTDEELEMMQSVTDQEDNHPEGWAEGRGYGDFPSEDDYQRWSDIVQGVEVPF